MANSQYHAVRKRMQSPPTIPPAADRQNSQTPRSVRPDVQVLLTRPKASPSLANKGKGVKPEMKQTLQLVNKEILQRLKACRGLNRRQHPLIPSIKERQACVVSPIMEDPQDEMQGVGQLKDHGRSQSPPDTVPEAAELSPHTLQGHWRQRLRSRAWRLPERPQGVQSVQSVQSAEPVVAASPTVPTRSSRVRGSRGSKEEARNGRARARERISLRRMSLEEFWAPFESGSAASSRRNSVQQESSHHGQARKSAAKRHGQAHSSRRGSANDRRHVSMRETDSDVEDADEDGDDVATGRLPDRTQPDRMHTLQALVEVETKEVELNFQVVKWSTQRQESPAADLEKQSGWWESANGVVENQFVIIQLANKEPKRLHALELNLPGNDAGPRFCKLQYSNESPDGPWKEAWSFQVVSKSDVKCRSTFETGSNLVKDFKEWLTRSYRGNVHEAWKLLFNDALMEIPSAEFLASMARIKQQMFHPNHGIPSWCEEAQKLAEELDATKSGMVSLASVLEPAQPPPEACYWKLTIVNNWGSTKRLQVMSPLRLTTLIQVQTGGLSRMRASFIEHQAGKLAGDSLIRAFDLETLGVDSEAVQLRRLAKKFGISILDIEDMHRLFSNATSDGKVIVQSEFTSMLLKLYGTEDLSEVPPQRLRFFWQQADQDGSGEIDFEEFIMWYDRYSEEILSRRKTRRHRESPDDG